MTRILLACAVTFALALAPAWADEGLGDKVEQFFKKFDKNGDGKVTPDEFGNEALFKKLDTTRDGAITREDFKAYNKETGEKPAEKPKGDEHPKADGAAAADELFKKYDKNGDGKISREEMQDNLKLFHSLDKNADGVIDRQEASAPPSAGKSEAGEMKRPEGGERRRPGEGGQGGRFQEMLKRFDKDGDGKISEQEWLDGQKEEFKRIDANGDGSVSQEEMAAHMQKMMQGRPGGQRPGGGDPAARAEQIFKQMDKNGDGVITKDEAGERMPFDQADTNGDGKITKDEFIEAMKKRMAGGRKPGGPGGEGKKPGADQPGAKPGEKPAGEKPAGDKPAESAGDVRAKLMERIFARFDTNGDGKITKDEWKGNPERFDQLDANKDGVITKDEIQPRKQQ